MALADKDPKHIADVDRLFNQVPEKTDIACLRLAKNLLDANKPVA